MAEHKHASVLRAIADGVPMSEFEIASNVNVGVRDDLSRHTLWILYPSEYEISRKPQYIMVNGFKVPKPLEGSENIQRVYTPALMDNQMSVCWYEPPNIEVAVNRAIAHTTKEAAIAHAKAMLGIDPKWEE